MATSHPSAARPPAPARAAPAARLAAALLLAGWLLLNYVAPAYAAGPAFTEQTGGSNPFNTVDVGDGSHPAFADIDGDGDLDAFIGEEAGNINYYENTHCSCASESDTSIAEGDVLQFGTGQSTIFVKVNTLGSLTSLTAACTQGNHPNAYHSGLQTGVYWTLTPNGGASGFDLDLTLPFKNPDANDKLCRYTGVGNVWDCAQTSRTATDFTRAGVTTLSDWLVGDDVGNDGGPTAVTLASFSATPAGVGAVAAGLLLTALLVLGGVLVWRKRGSKPAGR